MESVKHTIDLVGRIPGTNVDEWKVVLKYKDKEVILPLKVEKGAKMSECSTERLLYFYFSDANKAIPYPTLEAFHKGYVPHFDLPKAQNFFDAIKAVEVALVNLFGDDYQIIENQIKEFEKQENERRKGEW
ncbi:hypothetical protein [Bacillus toyonensis]|uniref:hypothetical protein n=1 Tax=Bacillus toyonensis TaxID=155322 RepID=UPI002E247F13|nr:hypothetical protein [Bacillus toyonensis]